MKKLLSLIAICTLLCIIFASVASCAKNNGSVGGNSDVGSSTVGITSVISNTAVTTLFLCTDALPEDYDVHSLDSFIEYWKKQQGPEADEESAPWRELDGSPDTSLLVPKLLKDEYQYFLGTNADEMPKPTDEDYFLSYTFSYLWTGEDLHTKALMSVTVYKGNLYVDIFQKDELTYDDLKYFVDTFEWNEFDEKEFGEIEYHDDKIFMRNEYRIIYYFIYSGQIVRFETTDDVLVVHPEKLSEYITFEEVTLD